LSNLRFGNFRYFESQDNGVFIEYFGVETMKNPEMFFPSVKLGKIIILEIFLNMWEVFPKLFREYLDWYKFLLLELFLHIDELYSLIEQGVGRVFHKETIVVE
jgi:hypothetical protein